MRGKRLHILYVDDEDDERFFFARAASASGVPIGVTNAASGNEALARLRMEKTPPDLLLLDIKMLGMSGFDLLEELKREGLDRMPVIAFSSSEHPRDLQRAKDMGTHAYFVKPPGIQELVQFVQRLYAGWLQSEIPCEWPAQLPKGSSAGDESKPSVDAE